MAKTAKFWPATALNSACRSPTGSRGPTPSPGSFLERSYEERQRKPDDLEAQEGKRPIAIHALENLAHSDTGIVMLRRLLREQLQRVEQGVDPINTMRDPSANKRIPTGAWNTILSPAEAAALSYSEDL
jgi:hypothetical protein